MDGGIPIGAASERGSPGLLLPVLTGVLVGTSYIPFPPWAMLFGFVPLWIFWLRETSWKRILLGGWVAQFVLALIMTYWVAHTAREFGHLSRTGSALVLLLYCAAGHLFLPVAGLAFALCRRRMPLPRWAALGLLPAFTALFWAAWPMLFPWNPGYAWLRAGMPVFQLAEYAGFEGLGAATIALNLAFLAAWENRRTAKGFRICAAALAAFAAANALGWLRGETLPPADAQARVLIVQGNIGNLAKERAERGEGFQEEILLGYFRATARGIAASEGRPPDFAVWPESAFPGVIREAAMDEGNARALREFLRARSLALVTGARGYDERAGKRTNNLYVFDENGDPAGLPYDKTMLLAFGEYVPGSGTFPALKRWFPRTADFARGSGPQAKMLHGLVLGPQICYEGLFPGFSRSLADQGAQVFLNVTNDSWFGTGSEPQQHLYMTLARGIEFRRPVIRSTNTGISTVMLADGTILERSPLRREWFRTYDIPYRKSLPTTFYQSHGHRLVTALLWLSPAGILFAARRRRTAQP